MRLLPLNPLPFLLLSSLSLLVHAARRTGLSPQEKIDKFSALTQKHGGVIPLNTELYDELTSGPRNYSASILLTALGPQFSCMPCKMFEPEHRMVAKQWTKNSRKNEHFFGVLDFTDGMEVYRRLNLNNAPTMQLWHPTEGDRADPRRDFEPYDFSRTGPIAEPFAHWLQISSKLPIDFKRPPNYGKIFSLLFIAVGTVVLGVAAWDVVKVVLLSRSLWALTTVLFIILMNSGYMWNQIRHPPYVMPGRDGSINYFAGGFQNQLGAETPIVGSMYGLLAFASYTLAILLPKLTNPIRQRLGIYVWTGMMLVMYGVLLQTFRLKNPGYPFRILF